MLFWDTELADRLQYFGYLHMEKKEEDEEEEEGKKAAVSVVKSLKGQIQYQRLKGIINKLWLCLW